METPNLGPERNETASRIIEGLHYAHVTSTERGRGAFAEVSTFLEIPAGTNLLASYIHGAIEHDVAANPEASAENLLAVRASLIEKHDQDMADRAQLEEAIKAFK